jgi:hypothetical protein
MATIKSINGEGKKLWLWKNGDHYLAFDNAYPCYPGGDPMTLGEPAAIAFLHSSIDRTPDGAPR